MAARNGLVSKFADKRKYDMSRTQVPWNATDNLVVPADGVSG